MSKRTARLSDLTEYKIWVGMIRRCTDPANDSYEDYGGRGIRVADEWIGEGGFARFFAHIGARPTGRHSVDRIDNDGHYEPGNVRWALPIEQVRNRRRPKRLASETRKTHVADLPSPLAVLNDLANAMTRKKKRTRWGRRPVRLSPVGEARLEAALRSKPMGASTWPSEAEFLRRIVDFVAAHGFWAHVAAHAIARDVFTAGEVWWANDGVVHSGPYKRAIRALVSVLGTPQVVPVRGRRYVCWGDTHRAKVYIESLDLQAQVS